MEYKLDACPVCDGIGELVFSEMKDLNIPVKCKICNSQSPSVEIWNTRGGCAPVDNEDSDYERGYEQAKEDIKDAIHSL